MLALCATESSSMPDQLSYAILGRGRWSEKIQSVLAGHGRRSVSIAATRAALDEDEAAYRARLTSAMIATDAHIAWLCLPPGPHIPLIVEAAIFAGLHVIVEKPWLTSSAETARLFETAQNAGRVVAVHYEYCFCREVETWRRQPQGGAGMQFHGRFTVDRPDRLGISAAENLGSHLLAIWEYAVPHAQVAEIHCGYELPNERRVWLEREGKVTGAINFLSNEPVIQRFIDRFESALHGADFPLDLHFADRVAAALSELKAPQNAKAQS